MGAMDGKGPDHLRPGQVGRTARKRIRPFPSCIVGLERIFFFLQLFLIYQQSAFLAKGPPSRYPLDQGVHGLAREHDALLELNKSNRGSPWTAISRFNRRSRVLMVGRPSAPSLDSSTRLSRSRCAAGPGGGLPAAAGARSPASTGSRARPCA